MSGTSESSNQTAQQPLNNARHEESQVFNRNWAGFFLLGLCTHLPCAIMDTAANTIAQSDNASNFVATVYGAGNGATTVVKNVNAFLLFRVSYGSRFLSNSILMLSGIIGLAFSQSFPLAIVSIVLVGASNAFGENLALGYLSKFDSGHVTAWGSGYGLAGLLGALLYVVFGCFIDKEGDPQDMRNLDKWAFISVAPSVIIYLTASLKLIKAPNKSEQGIVERHQSEESTKSSQETTPLLVNTADILRVQQGESFTGDASDLSNSFSQETLANFDADDDDVAETTEIHSFTIKLKAFFHQVKRCIKLVAWLSLCLAVIQFTSYTIRVAAAKARDKPDVTKCPEFYASLQLCYQVGVFVSQSSLPIGKIRQVGLLTLFQTINMLVWIFNENKTFRFLPVAILPFLMIIAGVLRGAVYVNIFYMIRTDSKYPDRDREMCANVASIFLTVGLSLSCILQTVLFNTVLLPY
ncbi:battenin-like [Asterias rubens]|uniref:battenin-like n=1 Tax=Asterias rubens TaxID=7604 RepID=UPI00145545F9|nr:battenin-like [Asterias rubens]